MQAKKSKSTKPRDKTTTKRPVRRGGVDPLNFALNMKAPEGLRGITWDPTKNEINTEALGLLRLVHTKETCLKVPGSMKKVRCIEEVLQSRIKDFLKEVDKDDTVTQDQLNAFVEDCSKVMDKIEGFDTNINKSTGTALDAVVGGDEPGKLDKSRSNFLNENSFVQKGKFDTQEEIRAAIEANDLLFNAEQLKEVRGDSEKICEAIDTFEKEKFSDSSMYDAKLDKAKLRKLSDYCKDVIEVIDMQTTKEGGGKSKKRMTAYRRQILDHIRVLVLNKVRAKLRKAQKARKALKARK